MFNWSTAITTPTTDSGNDLVRTKHYRYWKGTYNASTNPGHPHHLQYIVDFEGYRRADWAGDSTFNDTPLGMTETPLKPYASAYFEYEDHGGGELGRIVKAWFNGECGCSGAANGVHALLYEANPIAFIMEQAGGAATTGRQRIMDVKPDGLHQLHVAGGARADNNG